MKKQLFICLLLLATIVLRGQDSQSCISQLDGNEDRKAQIGQLMTCLYSKTNQPELGEVITSILDYDTFSATYGDSEDFNVYTSKWAPADGRNIEGSVYAFLSRQIAVPDFRGMFLRGLNSMAPDRGEMGLIANQRDPEANRNVGEFQLDALQGHWHELGSAAGDIGNARGNVRGTGNALARPADGAKNGNISKAVYAIADGENGIPRISKETRPKNVAVYYYIRIN